MKVGDYVRLNDGYIGKYHIEKENVTEYCWHGGYNIVESDVLYIGERLYLNVSDKIVKSSSNIKSVIEKDDFVNGERVNRVIPEDICGDELLDYQHIFVDDKEIYEEDIKSIVTKEMFAGGGCDRQAYNS